MMQSPAGRRPGKRLALLVLPVALALALAAYFLFLAPAASSSAEAPRSGAGATAGGEPDLATMVEVRVERKRETKTVESTGNFAAIRSVDLSFGQGGRIVSVAASDGASVAKGQAIARLEDYQQRYQLEVARANLESARITGSAREIALLELEVGFRAAELERTALRAPFAGLLSSLNVSAGDTVSSGAVVARVIDRSALVGVLSVDEIDLPLVRVGQKVRFLVDALPGRSFEGRVSAIPAEGQVSQDGIVLFSVEATLDSPPDDLLPGFSFSATIAVAEPRDYLSLPRGALRETPRGFTALVRDGKGAKRVEVEAIARADGSFEVVSGLAEGDAVLVERPRARSGSGSSFGIPGLSPPPSGFRP